MPSLEQICAADTESNEDAAMVVRKYNPTGAHATGRNRADSPKSH